MIVRALPGGPTSPTAPAPGPGRTSATETARPGAEPVRGTAYQTNADGDSATFSSKQADLSREERTQLGELRQRDQHVRTHEAAHKAAAGSLAPGAPGYTYQTGPDGRQYAVGGHVSIDTSPADTPEATIAKAARIRAAVLAPSDPSGADRAVAAKAARMESEARLELSKSDSGRQAEDRSAGALAQRLDLFA